MVRIELKGIHHCAQAPCPVAQIYVGTGQDKGGLDVGGIQSHRLAGVAQGLLRQPVQEEDPGPAGLGTGIAGHLLCQITIDVDGCLEFAFPGQNLGLGKPDFDGLRARR